MRSNAVVKVTLWLIVLALVVQVLVIASWVLGSHGFGLSLPTFGGRVWWESQYVMNARGQLAQVPVVDVDLAWEETSAGTRDASTGLPAVELSGPFTASVGILGPTLAERTMYLASRIAVPLVILLVLWLLFGVVSSVNKERPFTAENGRRIWMLALTVGVAGTVAGALTQIVDAWLISRSAAAEAFVPQGFVSLVPLLIGLLLAVLAVVWTRGVALEEETKGLI